MTIKVLMKTDNKLSVQDFFRKKVTLKYLSSKRKENLRKRGQRLVVHADDLIGMEIYVDGVFEKNCLDAFSNFIRPLEIACKDWLALDIGANIGNHSVYFSPLFGRIVSFEPNPSNFELLKLNASLSHNIDVRNFGLGESEKIIELYENEVNLGGTSAVYRKGEAKPVQVAIKKLDALDLDFADLGLIKIDVEGMEAEVIKGARATIARHLPIILFEQHVEDFSDADPETESIKLLRDFGYRFCWYQELTTKQSWLIRRMKNLLEIFTGRTETFAIVHQDPVPKNVYEMLIAIPPQHHELLFFE